MHVHSHEMSMLNLSGVGLDPRHRPYLPRRGGGHLTQQGRERRQGANGQGRPQHVSRDESREAQGVWRGQALRTPLQRVRPPPPSPSPTPSPSLTLTLTLTLILTLIPTRFIVYDTKQIRMEYVVVFDVDFDVD